MSETSELAHSLLFFSLANGCNLLSVARDEARGQKKLKMDDCSLAVTQWGCSYSYTFECDASAYVTITLSTTF